MIRSKAPVTVQEFGDRYTLLGPLVHKSASVEVEALEPTDPALREAMDVLSREGVKMLYGRWLIEGGPNVLLFDHTSVTHKLNEWKGDVWKIASISTPQSDFESNDAIMLGFLVAKFLSEVRASSHALACASVSGRLSTADLCWCSM